MLSSKLVQMFSREEQTIIEYIAMKWVSRYSDMEVFKGDDGNKYLQHTIVPITDRWLEANLGMSKEKARMLIKQLVTKHIGSIKILKAELNSIVVPINNDSVLRYDKISEETKDIKDENTIWEFYPNPKVIFEDIVKPTAESIAQYLQSTRSKT